jgi:uncharacterized protein
VATLEGAPLPDAPAPRRSRPPLGTLLAAGGVFVIAVGTFSVLALLVDGAAGWILYVFLIPFYAAFPTIMFPPYGGVVAAGAWLVLFPILRALLRTPRVRRYRERHGWVMAPAGGRSSRGGRWRSGGAAGGGFSGGGFSSRGGSSGGGGGFSGGGGSSGGGGASSGW